MVTLVAEMTRQGFGPYFGIYIGPDDMNSSMNLVQTYQGGLGLGDRDYYLKEDDILAGHAGISNPVESVTVLEYGQITSTLDELFSQSRISRKRVDNFFICHDSRRC